MKPEDIKNHPKNKDLDFFVMSICIFLIFKGKVDFLYFSQK